MHGRNYEWQHLNNADIVSMPDKWEYPWYAAWDLAFHTVAFALVDTEFAKSQLLLMTREWYMHPNGQLPAYEWAFGDVNPPVHAWATWRVFQMDRARQEAGGETGRGDLDFLERVFHKLMQLHLVGQSQGRAGAQHLSRWVSRVGQHRRL
jgi:mannosylglycerate hydrolase MGH1-like protein